LVLRGLLRGPRHEPKGKQFYVPVRGCWVRGS
jgi:hypothetical protein